MPELRVQDATAVLTWAIRTFPGKVALTASFGGGGLVLAHLISDIEPSVPVLFLNTAFHFPETLTFRDRFVSRYGLNLVELHPATDPGPLYQTDPDACCRIRKVEPFERAMAGYDAWITALRRDQSPQRATVEPVSYEEIGGRRVAKVCPLAGWSRAEVDQYLRDHDVPNNPLQDRGYTSIGCWPCTRPTQPGEPERAGRWSGTGKTECGLHHLTVPS